MMNYEIFKEVVKEKFMDYMPEKFKGMELVAEPVEKVNVSLDGIILREEGRNISPTIYINDMYKMDCQHFFRQIFLGYFPDIVQAFDTLGRNVYGDDYTSLHNPIVLSSVLLVYGMFHSTQILF